MCQPDVVVNCAAVSVPRACEVDPVAAMSVNVPTSVVNWLLSFKEKETLLIHLSTDQGTIHAGAFIFKELCNQILLVEKMRIFAKLHLDGF